MAHAQFDPAVAVVLAHEGGWVSDPADPGGETNFGISQVIIKRLKLTPAECGVADFARGSLKTMPRASAVAIYRRHYWDALGLSRLVHQTLATKLLDAAVNLSPQVATEYAQTVCRDLGQKKLAVDGKLGPLTVKALNAVDQKAWLRGFGAQMAAHYRRRVAQDPKLAKFLEHNWLPRAAWGVPA